MPFHDSTDMTPIAHFNTRHGDIVVLKSRSSVAYWQDDRHQSHADSRGISLAGYIHAIYGLLSQTRCRDVLMIGCGGGTLATMLRVDGVNVTIVDINEWSFRISRQYFRMPSDVECHVGDGRDFLQACSRKYDAIVLDAYDGDDIPRQLRTRAFFDLVKSRLREGHGCFLANVMMHNDRDRRLDHLARLMGAAWPLVRLLDAPGTTDRNAIAMAGDVHTLERPGLTIKPKTGSKDVIRALDALSFCFPRDELKRRRNLRTKERPLEMDWARPPDGQRLNGLSKDARENSTLAGYRGP